MAQADGVVEEETAVSVGTSRRSTLNCEGKMPSRQPPGRRRSQSHHASKCGMKADQDKALREHLTNLLDGKGAHLTLEDALGGLPKDVRGKKPANVPHTPWRLLEHIRIAQHDIVEFCTNPKYKEPKWPDDYWPKQDGPKDDKEWQKSIDGVHQDLESMKALVNDPKVDLFAKISWGDGQTYLREALLIADHNAYHIGEIVAVRRALGAWKNE